MRHFDFLCAVCWSSFDTVPIIMANRIARRCEIGEIVLKNPVQLQSEPRRGYEADWHAQVAAALSPERGKVEA